MNPYLVLLFGSYAYGSPHTDSDLDILVVLNDYTIPSTFKEKQALYLKVSSYTRNIARQIPVDMIVCTIPMYEHLQKAKNSFTEEILNKGIILYENKHSTMA